MIIGDPYKFAVLLESVEPWNTYPDKQSGLFCLVVDGMIFPSYIFNTNINVCLRDLAKAMKAIPVHEEFFSMNAHDAFTALYRQTYPEDFNTDNDYRFLLSPDEVVDTNAFVFAVRGNQKMRILAAVLDYDCENSSYILNGISIREAILEESIVQAITAQIDGMQY